jgi:hypothetical protein
MHPARARFSSGPARLVLWSTRSLILVSGHELLGSALVRAAHDDHEQGGEHACSGQEGGVAAIKVRHRRCSLIDGLQCMAGGIARSRSQTVYSVGMVLHLAPLSSGRRMSGASAGGGVVLSGASPARIVSTYGTVIHCR